MRPRFIRLDGAKLAVPCALIALAIGHPAAAQTPTAPTRPQSLRASITALRGTVKIRASYRHRSEPIGLFRAGQTIELLDAKPASRAGCVRGWYAVAPRGFVCASPATSFNRDHPRALAARLVLPADQGYPFQYARVTVPSPRWLRLTGERGPSEDPLLAHFAESTGPRSDAQGAYPGMKIAWARELTVDDTTWVVTPELHLINKAHIANEPSLLGRSVHFDRRPAFPFAITLRDTAEPGDEMARWPMTTLVPLAEGRFRGGIDLRSRNARRAARTATQAWIAKADISVFSRRKRPAGVGEDEKWVHVRVNEGALVAYSGDRAVFAAVISPGVHGAHATGRFRTPTGRFRIGAKHLTSDMGGSLGSGSWRSRAVPWVAYFHGGYALHGAWWHDAFGRPRSHGCINLTPGDARMLFKWIEPRVPEGWYAVRATTQHPGTVVVLTP